MAHCANDHDLFDPLFLEQIVQSGFSKGVGEILGNDRFITVRLHSFVDPATIAAGHEKRSVGHLVADVYHQAASRTPMGHDSCRFCFGCGAFVPGVLAARPVLVLQVDNADGAICYWISLLFDWKCTRLNSSPSCASR